MGSGSFFTDAKGRFAETVISTLLEHAGYRVLRLGVEELVSEVKAGVSRGEQALVLPDQLRTAPDFLVVDPVSGNTTLLEVKFRRRFECDVAAKLHTLLQRQENYWPGFVSVFLCPNPPGFNDSSKETDIRQFVRCLKASDLNRLIEPHERLTKWQRLRTLGAVFERVGDQDFYKETASLIGPIRAWA
ncbi:hypothetical protein [Marinimicrobium alkaliphilum]|uniref:hypothetical protein n=1 Tax=Marinimicrobium alkaliphilum TaxID=2202654 RepID=UPI000DB929D5|nr:hypothetical protein [Marinimicrobium alkaliphilum]